MDSRHENRPLVWHLLSNRWNSAITEYALSAARALELSGYRSIFSPVFHSPAASRAFDAGLRVEAVASFSIRGAIALQRQARTNEPDFVMTYGGPESFWATRLRFVRQPRFIRLRGQTLQARALQRVRLASADRRFDLVLAPGHRLAAEIRGVCPNSHLEVVTLGIDDARFRREGVLRSDCRPEVLVFGRFDPVKGHRRVIKIFGAALRAWGATRPRPRLRIVGEPANVSITDLEQAVAEEQLVVGQDVLIASERIEDVKSLMSSVALGIVPSLGSEVICRVAQEFLLCGTPVLVSGVGSLEDVLFHGAGASFRGLSDGDAAALACRWLALSLAEGEAAKLVRSTCARKLFGLNAMGARLAHLFQRLGSV